MAENERDVVADLDSMIEGTFSFAEVSETAVLTTARDRIKAQDEEIMELRCRLYQCEQRCIALRRKKDKRDD